MSAAVVATAWFQTHPSRTIEVSLSDRTTALQVRALELRLRSDPRVEEVVYLSKAQVSARFHQRTSGKFRSQLRGNPLNAVLKLTVRNRCDVPGLRVETSEWPELRAVVSHPEDLDDEVAAYREPLWWLRLWLGRKLAEIEWLLSRRTSAST